MDQKPQLPMSKELMDRVMKVQVGERRRKEILGLIGAALQGSWTDATCPESIPEQIAKHAVEVGLKAYELFESLEQKREVPKG